MKALVKYEEGPGNMEIREVPEPEAAKGMVKIKVVEAGICGSDLHIYHSDIAIPVRPPVTTGHEFSGIVAEVGEGVTAFKPGDRVVSETAFYYCGKCDYCREGFYNLCVERKTLGYWFNGIFGSYTVVPEDRVHKIADHVDFTSAAMTEPLACVCHAVYDQCRIEGGDVVLVIGCGAIGIMSAQVAKANGAKVILSGMSADRERLKLAEEIGACDYTVDVQREDMKKLVNDLTGGYGVDVVLECSGSQSGTCSGLDLIKKRGYFCQIGLGGKEIQFPIETICYKELHFSGSMGSRRHSWTTAIKLIEDQKVNLKPLVTKKLPLTQWKKAFDMFENKEGCKLFLIPE
ncbi:MAG: zinc-binding dehydrogenase [Lachnospiraceae bacterium]|jgi:L-iditol 2-dehydrogenase|nr:zinc-binding dehydrogenase [Lachnospiraceae bacterium]